MAMLEMEQEDEAEAEGECNMLGIESEHHRDHHRDRHRDTHNWMHKKDEFHSKQLSHGYGTHTYAHAYDWLLDGDETPDANDNDNVQITIDSIQKLDENTHTHHSVQLISSPVSIHSPLHSPPPRRRKKTLGDEDLDCALEGLELESSCSNSESATVTGTMTGTETGAGTDTTEVGIGLIHGFRNLLSRSSNMLSDLVGTEGEGDNPQMQMHTHTSTSMHSSMEEEEDADLHVQCNERGLYNLIPEFLPFEDPSSAEGKFIRGIQMEFDKYSYGNNGGQKQEGEGEGMSELVLPPEFDINARTNIRTSATSARTDAEMEMEMDRKSDSHDNSHDSYDPVVEMLNNMPWEVDLFYTKTNTRMDTDSISHTMTSEMQLITTLSTLDELSQDVTEHLLQQVKLRNDDIAMAMTRTRDVDFDICSALTYANQAASCLNRARGVCGNGNGNGNGDGDEDEDGDSDGYEFEKNQSQDQDHNSALHLHGSKAGILGGHCILQEFKKRDRLRNLDELLRSIEEVARMEQDIFNFCNDDNFATNIQLHALSGESNNGNGISSLLDTCHTLKTRILQDEQLSQLTCLDESRRRISWVMEYLCHQIEEGVIAFLYRQCNYIGIDVNVNVDVDANINVNVTNAAAANWKPERFQEYSTLLDARLLFGDCQVQEESKNCQSRDLCSVADTFSADDPDLCQEEEKVVDDMKIRPTVASAWAESLLKGFYFEADRCLARALLDPTSSHIDGSEDTNEASTFTSEFEENLQEIRIQLGNMQAFDESAASLRSIVKNLISIRFEFERKDHYISSVFHKLCVTLADLLHTHYMICQWHHHRHGKNNLQQPQPQPPIRIIDNDAEGVHCDTLIQEDHQRRNPGVEKIDRSARDDNTKSTYSSQSSQSSYTPTSISTITPAVTGSHEQNMDIPQCISGPLGSGTENESDGSASGSDVDVDVEGDEEVESDTCARIRMSDIHDAVEVSKIKMWAHISRTLVAYLDIMLNMNETEDSEGHDESWGPSSLNDLENLCDIHNLCHQMKSLGKEFLGAEEYNCTLLEYEGEDGNINVKCELDKAVLALCERFTRGAHVGAMTELGTMMATETWDLLPVPVEQDTNMNTNDDNPTVALRNGIQNYLKDLTVAGSSSRRHISQPLWKNHFTIRGKKQHLLSFCEDGNPFMPIEAPDDDSAHVAASITCNHHDCDDATARNCELANKLYDKVIPFFNCSSGELTLGTKSSLNGLVRWTRRLLIIHSKIPLVSEQISNILINLYDLYFVTVFRLCSSSGFEETILLKNQPRSDTIFNERFPQDLPPSKAQLRNMQSLHQRLHRSNSHSLRRNTSVDNQSSSSIKAINTLVSKHCEADIHAPLSSNKESIAKVNKFMRRGQKALCSMVNLDQIEKWSLFRRDSSDRDERVFAAKCLEKRAAAASSLLFVACLFETSFRTFLAGSSTDLEKESSSQPLENYLKDMLDSINCVYILCLQIASTRAISSRNIILNIVLKGSGWTDSKLNEHCNSYIDDLSDRYVALWIHLSTSPLKASKKILHDIWESIVESGCLALLEGISRVYDCSTEGRALMSMDLQLSIQYAESSMSTCISRYFIFPKMI
uniref:Syndetin C-terminal domain-containing protein n=1 Tax=Chaetoceros debilis TaxID=122233 RepID=A0A7S3VDF8_9STRA